MHAIVRQANGVNSRSACRIVGGARYALARSFHPSAIAYRPPEDPAGVAPTVNNDGSDGAEGNTGQSGTSTSGTDTKTESIDHLQRSGRRREHASALRRASRSRKSPEIPPFVLPAWFLQNNVSSWETYYTERILVDFNSQLKKLSLLENSEQLTTESESSGSSAASTSMKVKAIEAELQAGGLMVEKVTHYLKVLEAQRTAALRGETGKGPSWPHWLHMVTTSGEPGPVRKLEAVRDSKARVGDFPQGIKRLGVNNLSRDVFVEILTSFHSGLTLPPPSVNIKEVFRPEIRLFTPRSGGLDFLEATVHEAASLLQADVIRLDCENLAEMLGEYLGENVAWAPGPTSLLGYECQSMERTKSPEIMVDDEEEEADGENDAHHSEISPDSSPESARAVAQSAIGMVEVSPNFIESQNLMHGISLVNFLGKAAQSSSLTGQTYASNTSLNELKLDRALEAIINAAASKRSCGAGSTNTAETGTNRPESGDAAPGGIVIHVSEFKKLNDHPHGRSILNRLREVVKRRWYEGKRIIIVGTTVVNDPERTVLQARHPLGTSNLSVVGSHRHRSIFVPPPSPLADRTYDERKRLNTNVNIRRLKHMIGHLSADSTTTYHLEVDQLKSHVAKDLSESMWNYARVRRTATTMLSGPGAAETGKTDWGALVRALTVLEASDRVKFGWADEAELGFKESLKVPAEKNDRAPSAAAIKKFRRDGQLAKIRASCNRYEKKLLGGIIEPDDIHTTFEDVRAPAETIEALKTLTTLSFIRPEAFSYGVLASDKIPGLLIYGPPGTGKTLLAKAVAKESGATVLEVSAAEINDMYVGEGEKNVKAVFSLAAKLSPCVVFIDEADAIFAARGSMSNRRTHREQLNQFLREWDGMKNLNAFIMVATNRPFDLDDAVIRRLPRRLLVDLPVEKDREAILRIHLKDEILDESISLTELAKNTPYYSGSDLKNLSVAAALACVREENEIAVAHTGEEPYRHLAKRILRKEHFHKAREEISASISEDMGSLTAIRKFDEKYGDRKGRRKKAAALGFGGTMEPEKDSEGGRVRQIQLDV